MEDQNNPQSPFTVLTFDDLKPETIEEHRERLYAKMQSRLDEENGYIDVWTGHDMYSIELGRLVDSAEVLDFILQIHEKEWDNKNAVTDFLELLDLACHIYFRNEPQGVFCSMGMDHVVDWVARTSVRRKKTPSSG